MILSPHRILWYSYSPPPLPRLIGSQCSTVPPFSSIGDDWPLSSPPPPPPPFHLKANGIPPKNLPHLSENEWKLIPNRVGKAVSSFEIMTKSHTKSHTDKLQDITCARGWGPVFICLANTSRRSQCACPGDMKTLKLSSSRSPWHSHSIGQTGNTLGSAANSRNAQGNTSMRPYWIIAMAVAGVSYTFFLDEFWERSK